MWIQAQNVCSAAPGCPSSPYCRRCPLYVMLPTEHTTTAVPLVNTSSACREGVQGLGIRRILGCAGTLMLNPPSATLLANWDEGLEPQCALEVHLHHAIAAASSLHSAQLKTVWTTGRVQQLLGILSTSCEMHAPSWPW